MDLSESLDVEKPALFFSQTKFLHKIPRNDVKFDWEADIGARAQGCFNTDDKPYPLISASRNDEGGKVSYKVV